jgi:mannose-6-phosphate isomerase
MNLYPLKMEPCLVEKIWGGSRLKNLFPAKGISTDALLGESWELAVRADHDSVITNGEYKGTKLSALIARYGDELVGLKGLDPETGRFPLLLKFLDASKVLSVQVHPDDEYALEHENDLGKTEAWYIISAEPGASLIKGVKPGTDAETFRTLLQENRLEECLNSFEVAPGDLVFLPPHTLHAIGEGLVLFEIQQNSDVTYRAYDWGRTDSDGIPRELHVDKVFEVADFSPPENNTETVEREEGDTVRTHLLENRYFVLEELKASSGFGVDVPDDRFLVLTCVKGGLRADDPERTELSAGETVLLPAGYSCKAEPQEDSLFLVSYVSPSSDWFRE